MQEDQSDDEEGDGWLLQDELAKLKEEWDDYVDNLEGELEMEDYPPIDMKERLRKLNEEWGAEEEVVRTNTKVNFSEKLVTLEVPPPEYQEDSDSDLEIESRVAQVMEEEEVRGDGDNRDGSEQHQESMDVVVGDLKGEGDKQVVEDSSTDMFAKQLNVSDSDSKEEERTDVNVDNSPAQINANSQDEQESLSSPSNEIKSPEDGGTEFKSGTSDISPEQSKEEQVLIERDGKFELKKVSDLSVEERDIMGIPSPVGKNRNTNNDAAEPDDGSKTTTKAEKSKTPARKERPSTAKTYQSPQQQPTQKRRIQSAKSASIENTWQYEKPEGYSKYGLSPEQKESKKKQMMLKSQRLQERRQKEEEEKKRQQEEAESAFQAWVKRKQQEAIERKKLERQKQKESDVKVQKVSVTSNPFTSH